MATIADLKRMCNSLDNSEGHILLEKCSNIIDDWIKKHPKKTYRDDFLEKFPDAPVDSSGFPNVCLMDIYQGADYKRKDEDYGCNECWNQEYKKC